MFSKLLDAHRRRYNGMAFQVSSHMLADKAATRECFTIFNAWFEGQERAYAVEDALLCLVILYGDPVKAPCRTFWRALRIEDETQREILAHEALRQLERHFRSYVGLLETLTGWEHRNRRDPFA